MERNRGGKCSNTLQLAQHRRLSVTSLTGDTLLTTNSSPPDHGRDWPMSSVTQALCSPIQPHYHHGWLRSTALGTYRARKRRQRRNGAQSSSSDSGAHSSWDVKLNSGNNLGTVTKQGTFGWKPVLRERFEQEALMGAPKPRERRWLAQLRAVLRADPNFTALGWRLYTLCRLSS